MHELTVLPASGAKPRRRIGRWRAASLVAVQLVMLAHVAHWAIAGRTLSPVEPSESMYALELGQVNAGFVFFVLAILSTVLFGRFFCGWGCHVVALQDGCGWILRKLHVRPVAFRSRLLALAPVALALYMFVWPSFARVVLGAGPPFPGWSNHLVTTSFWRTFPGPVFGVLTLLSAGALAVVVLGSKGFCTYGCPYGAFFAAADRLSPTRIVVSDGCQQTGQCTVTCTSNVRVNEEVKLHGMVVDPRCMKCMDCVAGCPNDALALSFAKPALLDTRTPGGDAQWRTLATGEEALVACIALAATLAFRGLYDGPPLLMAIALGGVTGWLALKAWQLARERSVRAQWLTLKAGGDVSRAGWAFALVTAGWLAFTTHSAFVQWHRFQGARWLERTEVGHVDGLGGTFDPAKLSPAHGVAVLRAARHFGLADRFGLVDVPEVELGLAWTSLLSGDVDDAERRIRGTIAQRPTDGSRHDHLVELLVARDRLPEALAALEAKVAVVPASETDRQRLAQLHAALDAKR